MADGLRELTVTGLLLVLLSALAWSLGGIYLAVHVFRLRVREQLIVGLALGWVLYIVLANLLMRWLLPGPAGLVSGALVLSAGSLSAWREQRSLRLKPDTLRGWPPLLALVLLTLVFTLINRGLALFDDYHNLPLLSLMAAGDVPPHFYYNPGQPLAYHYGLHIFAAQLVAQGGFFPWSALDLGRALALAVTLCLAWLWFLRRTENGTAAWLGTLLVLLGSGARWLLLLLPSGVLARLDQSVELLGSAAQSGLNLSAVLVSAWQIEGAGPFPFPFAFANGLHHPLNLALNGSGALPFAGLFLLLVLGEGRVKWIQGLLLGLVLAGIALSAEHIFVLVCAGLALAALVDYLSTRDRARAGPWVLALFSGGVLALVQGGVLTELARGWFLPGAPLGEGESYGFHGFSWSWQPALLSAHFGRLELFSPSQLLVALFETGPALLLGVWVTVWSVRAARRGRTVEAGLGLGAALVFTLALFLRYGVERDLSRLFGIVLFVWLVLGWPLVWEWVSHAHLWGRILVGGAYAAVVAGGLALLLVQIIAISRPQLSYFVTPPDAQLSRVYWNRLEPGALVFDSVPYRSITLFGRSAGRVGSSLHEPFPEWQALITGPDPGILAGAGYTYAYFDRTGWQALQPAQRDAFQDPCVRVVAEAPGAGQDFRRLLDIRDCR